MQKKELSASLPVEGFVRLSLILMIFPFGKTTWWKGIKEGRFPAPVKLGPRTTAWRVEDIRALIANMEKTRAPRSTSAFTSQAVHASFSGKGAK